MIAKIPLPALPEGLGSLGSLGVFFLLTPAQSTQPKNSGMNIQKSQLFRGKKGYHGFDPYPYVMVKSLDILGHLGVSTL